MKKSPILESQITPDLEGSIWSWELFIEKGPGEFCFDFCQKRAVTSLRGQDETRCVALGNHLTSSGLR